MLAPAVGAQKPAPVPRVDSIRVDTLHAPPVDSARRVVLPKPMPADTAKKPSLLKEQVLNTISEGKFSAGDWREAAPGR